LRSSIDSASSPRTRTSSSKHIRPASTLDEAVAGAAYVQESTAERVDVKQVVFAQMDAAAAPGCILASSDVYHSGIRDQRAAVRETFAVSWRIR
jgi:3-hydroxyacyl-CoA dehydrogenase